MTATDEPKPARRNRQRLPLAAAAGLALLAGVPAARAAVEENYASGEPPITTTWFAPVSDAARRTDREYIAGMRPHHAGALSMSRQYLADPGRSSPQLQALARAIIANQTFEIGVLDQVGRDLDRPPVRLPFGLALQPVATEGLTGAQRFFREPIPSGLAYSVGPVSERDVRFAKAMTIHHQAAVEMARGYQADPDARSGFLGLLNVDIVTDQTQEIALMRRVIAAYPGDPDAVPVDPSMVHGMEGMKHGGHGAAGPMAAVPPLPLRAEDGHARQDHGSAPAATAQPRQARPRPRPAVRRPAEPAAVGQGDHGHHHDR